MPISISHHKAIRAQVRAIPSDDSTHETESEEIGTVSSELWNTLVSSSKRGFKTFSRDDHLLAVALDFNLSGTPATSSHKRLIIWVKASSATAKDLEISIPTSLLPKRSEEPFMASVQLHDPIPLTLAILQPILTEEGVPSSEELDLGSLINRGVLLPPTNGHQNGPIKSPFTGSQILRQGSCLSIPFKRKLSHPSTYRILMLEPVQQGILTSETKVIISNVPYHREEDMKLRLDTESLHSKTHLSLEDFDPDAFLSSSLALSLSHDFVEGSPILEIDMVGSISSETSGSITPRPYINGDGPGSPPAPPDELSADDKGRGGTEFRAMIASGPSSGMVQAEEVAWVGMSGLGRAGIFEGDWVLLKSESDSVGRLIKVQVWEDQDEWNSSTPANPIFLSPTVYRSLQSKDSTTTIYLHPTPFGARRPTIPTATGITLARLATAEGVDKRYERSWLQGLKKYFDCKRKNEDERSRLVKRGDVILVPIRRDSPVMDADEDDDGEEEEEEALETATAIAYFIVTALSYEPLLALEDDFSSTVPSKARSGELGCWVDAGEKGVTKMVLTGVERAVVNERAGDLRWHEIGITPEPYSSIAVARIRDLLKACLSSSAMAWSMQLSILIKGARGSGKSSLIRHLADEVGFNVIQVECFDIVGDTHTITEGTIKAQLEKAKSCAPSIVLLNHVEALAKKSETGKAPQMLKVLEDALSFLKDGSAEMGWPLVLIGTTVDEDSVPPEILGCFKQDVNLSAPNEDERLVIVENILDKTQLSPDVNIRSIATQTAALQAGDIKSLIIKAQDISLERALKASGRSSSEVLAAGLAITVNDINAAIAEARSSYSDSIGAPKIPNVSWDDVGGLANVKADILDTIQLPLEHPELFADGLKKRSGILLYGPPGTGKTLLAKAVATSLSLNFFSVKGPELLNMYIGESEANVRRVFQRARDAAPCVIFMDELDSVAPKRGNQGDSGGVMDRIVSQLLAELDGMGGGGVYVMGATNRPDLLDPALLRPGRFDRMLYLGVPTTSQDQLNILHALTRKFQLDPQLDMAEVAEQCPFNYTGADLYALCSDAMLKAMTRVANQIDARIAELNKQASDHGDRKGVYPLTPQYYLASMASPEEMTVSVGKEDFEQSLQSLVASVSEGEMEHYRRVQDEFKGFNIGT